VLAKIYLHTACNWRVESRDNDSPIETAGRICDESERPIPFMKRLILLLSLAATCALSAQETPTITIRKGEASSLALQGLGGSQGKAVQEVLENDLSLSGWFDLVPEGQATYLVSGTAASGSLEGIVKDRTGSTVLSKRYGGEARDMAHEFADDIVETITGQPGIATSRIAFVGTRSGKKEIYTADYDGRRAQQLTRDNAISVAPALTPDGQKLAYTGYQSGYADIYLVDLRSGSRQRIVKFPGTNSGAAFSPDGRRMAATLSKDGNPELYVMNATGGGPKRLTKTRGVESSPSWSPDGSKIVFSSDDRGGPQLFIIDAGGGSMQPIRSGHGYNTEPSWSPDGEKIAFNVKSGGGFAVAVHNLRNGSTTIVGRGEDPVWGASSRHLIYSSGSGLILLDVPTGRTTNIVSGVGKVTEPTWSR